MGPSTMDQQESLDLLEGIPGDDCHFPQDLVHVTKHTIELGDHGLDLDHVLDGRKDVVDGNVSIVVAEEIDDGGDGVKSDEIGIQLKVVVVTPGYGDVGMAHA
ncbi:hypothetical protein COCNU_scaffold001569G000020 [Cocos nucifera]|nr:hypothetical protein [Cocos nucifera]